MYSEIFQKSLAAVEAARDKNIALEPARMTAQQKEELLAKFHPDYKKEEFQELKIGANKGDKVALEITEAMAEKGSDYICAHLKMQNFEEETVNVVLSGSMNVKMPNEIYLAALKEKCEAKSGRKLNFIKLEAAPVTGCINWLLEDK